MILHLPELGTPRFKITHLLSNTDEGRETLADMPTMPGFFEFVEFVSTDTNVYDDEEVANMNTTIQNLHYEVADPESNFRDNFRCIAPMGLIPTNHIAMIDPQTVIEFRKHVFIVEDIHDQAGKIYFTKVLNVTNAPDSIFGIWFLSNEVKVMDLLQEDVIRTQIIPNIDNDVVVEERTKAFPGIVGRPVCFNDYIQLFAVFELYPTSIQHTLTFNNPRMRVSEDVAIIWLYQLLHIVRHMAAHQVVHRQIMPSAICLDENGNCVLTDFQNAVVCHTSTNQTGDPSTDTKEGEESFLRDSDHLRGIYYYSSPEANGMLEELIPGTSDIWSVGVIAYDLLSAQACYLSNPWNIETDGTMTRTELAEHIRSREVHRSEGMSDNYANLMERMLTFDVNGRIDVENALSHPLFDEVRIRFTSIDDIWTVGGGAHPELADYIEGTNIMEKYSLYNDLYGKSMERPVLYQHRLQHQHHHQHHHQHQHQLQHQQHQQLQHQQQQQQQQQQQHNAQE